MEAIALLSFFAAIDVPTYLFLIDQHNRRVEEQKRECWEAYWHMFNACMSHGIDPYEIGEFRRLEAVLRSFD